MASVWDEIESGPSRKAPVARSVWDEIETGVKPKGPERTFLGTLGDVGVTALKGAVGLPASFVGLADIPTGGRVGKALEEAGYRPEDTQKILDTWYSDAQQAANRKVQQAEGFVDTLGTALQNPSTILTTAGESLPQMIGGAGIARGLMRAAPKVAPWAAAAFGEGLLGAGSAAEQIRAETPDGLLTPGQSGAALASGVGTGLLGAAGGRLANRLGLGDVDTALAQGAMGAGKKGLLRNVGGSALSEGVFEELPQSFQEQVWQNVALGKPWDEGVGNAAAMGMLAGGLTGGGFGALNNRAIESSLLRREEDAARQQQERQEQLAPILGLIRDDPGVPIQNWVEQQTGVGAPLNDKQRKAREADILAAFNEPTKVRVAGEDGQERELTAIEASLMQQGLPTAPITETPAPAAPPSRVYSPEEQELITMGIVPNGNALSLLAEMKATGIPLESSLLTPAITAMSQRKNGQAKKLLAQAIIESKKAPATVAPVAPAAPAPVAAAPTPTVAPTPAGGLRVAVTPDASSPLVPPNLRLPTAEQIAADQQANPQAWGPSLNTQAPTSPVAQAPGVTSLPVQEAPTNVQADQAIQAEAQGEAPLAATAAQDAATATEPVATDPVATDPVATEPVVQRKRRVVNPAALQQAQAFVAPEAVADEETSSEPTDETDWEDSKPDGAPALTALTPSLQQVWSEARAAKAQGRRVNLFKVAEDLVAEQGDEVADDDTLTTLNQIFGERDAAMLYDRYVDNQTEEAIANKYGLSRQAVAKVTGEGSLGQKTRAAKIKNAQQKFGWTDEYVQGIAERLAPPQQATEADSTSGRTSVDLEATESAFGADNTAETGGNDPSLREAGFSTSASLGGSVSNWRDSGELAGRADVTQADQVKLDGLYARRASAEDSGNDSEVESADAEISMVEAKYLSPSELAAKHTQRAMDLQDKVAKREQQIEQARSAGKTEVSVNNKLVPIEQLEQETAELQTQAQAEIDAAEGVLQRGAVRKARGAEAPKVEAPKLRRVKKADAAAPAAPAATTAPTEVLTPTEGASRAWDQAANTIPGAPKWQDLPEPTRREFVGYGENNWTRQDVVSMMQRSAPQRAAAPAPAAAPIRKEGPSGYSFPSSAVVSGIRNEFEPAEVQEVAIGETSDGFVNFGIVNSDGRYYIQSKRKVITFSNGNWGTPTTMGMDVQGTYDPNNLQEEVVRVLTEQGAKRSAPKRAAAMRSPGITSVDSNGDRFTSRSVTLDEMLTHDGINRAVRHMTANGLADAVAAVQAWYITDDPVSWDAIFADIDGKPAVVFSSEALNDRARAVISFVHEVGHAVDETHLDNWTFSSEPEFNLSLGKNGVRPMGAVAVELLDHYENGDSALSQLLEYPLDLQGESGTRASRIREELFAQVWAFSALADGMQFLRDNLPATAAFMESVHDQVRQTYAAQARSDQGSQPGQVQGGRQGEGVLGARPSRQTQAGLSRLPAELQKPVGTITNALSDTKNAALNALTFTEDVINRAIDLGVTAAGKLRSIYQERTALTGKLEREVERVAELYNKVPEAERGTGPRSVNLFLRDATREGKWGFKPSWRTGASAKVTIDPDMQQRFNALSKESKALVEAVFRHGDEVLSLKKQTVMAAADSEYDALISAANKAGDAKKAARLTADKADQLKRFNSLFELQEFRPYAPLKRFGDYVVIAKSQKYLDAEKAGDEKTKAKLEKSEDDYHVSFAESAAAARELVEQLNEQGAFSDVVFRQKEAVQQTMFGGMMSAFNKLRSELDSELANAQPGEKAAIRAARKVIGELYLSSLAEASARKSEMRRRGVAGEIDMLRSFTSQGRADAQFIAGAKYNNQTLDAFNEMRRQVKSGGAEEQNTKSGVFNELMKRHTQSMDYDPSPISDKLARLTSIWYLATSPAYYLQNLTQPFMMSLPVMAGRHNYLKVAGALVKAYSDLAPMFRTAKLGEQFNYGAAPQDVRAAISTLVDRGRIDIGMDTDLGQFRLEGEGPVKDRWNKVDRGLRSLSQKMEAINRLSTAMAAYRMELAKTGDTAAALKYADDIITQTHGDYTRTNAPRAFNTATGKVALQFRKFQLIQLTLLAKLVHNSFTGTERAAARKALGFLLGHTAVMAGAVGLPGFAALSWMLGLLKGGKDDEPFNLEEELRRLIGNEQVANLITRGAPAALGVDLSNKLGSGNVLSLLPFNDLDLSSRSGAESAMAAVMGGPAGSLGLRAADGLGLMRDGQYYRGLEQLVPTGVANAMKAYRTANEGVTRRNGDVLISPDEISGMESFWQALGFQPTELAVRQFRDTVKRGADDKFAARAERIRNAFLRAKDDPDARSNARDDWAKLQDAREAAGYRRQPLSSLMRAEQNQRQRERNTLGGIQFNRDTRRFVEELTQE